MKKLFDKMTENIGLRIASVLIAGLLWIVIVNVSDPIAENVYSGVKVEILNAGEITDENMTYQILDNTDNISVTVVAKRSINDLLSKDNIRAYADMNDLNEADGTVKIHLETNKYNEKIESIRSKTEYLLVEIEPVQKKMLAITPVVNGEPSSGFITGDVVLDQNVVSIQGPESVISKIETATAEVSVTGMNNNISTTSSIRYYDAEGDQIEAGRITGNISAVSVNVEILATKTVPIELYAGGTPADGYSIKSVSYTPQEVVIYGPEEVLAEVDKLVIPDISVQDATESIEENALLIDYIPDNTYLPDPNQLVAVNITLEEHVQKKLPIKEDNISVKGVNSNYTYKLIVPSPMLITVSGLSDYIDGMKNTELGAYVDYTDYTPGEHDVPIQFKISNDFDVVGDYTVKVIVVDKSTTEQATEE